MATKLHQEKVETTCFHCGEICINRQHKIEEKIFCCSGCEMVYELLHQNELCTYYDLNANPGAAQKFEIRGDKFAFLDDTAIAQKLVDFSDDSQTQISLYLPQMHCSSCLWLLEHINKINNGILSSRVNFTQKEVFIVFDPKQTSLRKVVETLSQIGYEPHISLQDLGHTPPKIRSVAQLSKIGVAGFCFVNIMMLSLPEYFSIGGYLETAIGNAWHYIIVGLSIPVMFYCATDFFILAWKGLQHRWLNIDFPIALALLITYLRSLYELLSGTGVGYFDSLSGIVFLMLLGRFLQDRTYQSISFDRDFRSFFPIAVNTLRAGDFVPVSVEELKEEDIIRIHAQEILPVDAIVSKGLAEIDYSFVSGESEPQKVAIGSIVYAGGKQLSGMLELIVVKSVSQSYLTNLWNKDVFKNEKRSVSFIHQISKYFTFAVLLIVLLAALYWQQQGQMQLMWNAITTVLIVACPCALLLSATFTNGNMLRILSSQQFYLRHPDVIEDLSQITHVVFDKTGTITENKGSTVLYQGDALSLADKQALASISAQSLHPLSKIIYKYLDLPISESIASFKEVPGQGIEAWVMEQHIKLGSPEFVGAGQLFQEMQHQAALVCFNIDNKKYGAFIVHNSYRAGFSDLVSALKGRYVLSILSGDNDAERSYLQSVLGPDAILLFDQKPEDKLAYIQQVQADPKCKVLMIGDGLNDAGALKQSTVGVALAESANNFTPASDAILDAGHLAQLARFLSFATAGRSIILASFILSIGYNIIGLSFAVQGTLSPLLAAVLMPASSISIILLTYGLSEWYGKTLKRKV